LFRKRGITRRCPLIRVDSILSLLGDLRRGMIHLLLAAFDPFIRRRLVPQSLRAKDAPHSW
jgi:hypothetical protein